MARTNPKTQRYTTANKRPTGTLSDDEKTAVEWYASGDGMWINQYYRGLYDTELSEQEQKWLKDLESAVNSGTVKEDTLYRALTADAVFGRLTDTEYEHISWVLRNGKVENKFEQSAIDKANKALGKTITEKGFMSTTRDYEIAKDMMYFTGSERPVILEIHGTRGMKGLDVGNATPYLQRIEKEDPQKETLLARGVKYEPVKLRSDNGIIIVEVRIRR